MADLVASVAHMVAVHGHTAQRWPNGGLAIDESDVLEERTDEQLRALAKSHRIEVPDRG